MGNNIEQVVEHNNSNDNNNTYNSNSSNNNVNVVDSIYIKTQSYSLDNLCTVIKNLCEVSHKQLSLRNNANEKITFNTTIPLFDVCSVNTHRSQHELETIYNQVSSYYMNKILTNKHNSHICNSSLLCLSKVIAILLSVNNKHYTNNYQTMLLMPFELIYTKNTSSSSTTTTWPFTETIFEYMLTILNTDKVIVSTGWNVLFNIIKHALTQSSPSNAVINHIIAILHRTESEIERNVRNISVYKGYIEFMCQFYVMNDTALKDTVERILHRLLCVALMYNNNSNSSNAVVLCKYYFFALDEFMFSMNVSFHLKIVFDLIESTFTDSSNNININAVDIFKCVYYSFIKIHYIILLMAYHQSNNSISTLIAQMQTELNREDIEIESEYIRKKVELLRKITEDEYNNNVSDFINKYMNLIYIAFESNDNETKSIYYSDFITTSIRIGQYHSSPHLLFDIIRDMIMAIESNVSSSFWINILHTITTTTQTVNIHEEDVNDDNSQIRFYVLLFGFIEKVVTFIPQEVFSGNNSNVSELYMCLCKVSNMVLLKLIKDNKSKYKEQMYLIVEAIAKIKVTIYNKSVTAYTVGSYQSEVIALYYKNLHSLYKCNCNCDSDNTLMSVIYIECKYILMNVIGCFDKDNRKCLFNMLIDLLADERSHIRLVCKELMYYCFNNNICAFHVNSLQSS